MKKVSNKDKLQLISRLLSHPDINKSDFIIYFYLVYISKDKKCEISYKDLSAATQMSREHAWRCVQKLNELKYIKMENVLERTGYQANRYTIL